MNSTQAILFGNTLLLGCCCYVTILPGCESHSQKAEESPTQKEAPTQQLAEVDASIDESPAVTTVHQRIQDIEFDTPEGWQVGRTNTPATKLFLFVPDDKGGARGMLKVDVGKPVEQNFAAIVKGMDGRFQGSSEELVPGQIAITSTDSSSLALPRYIFSVLVNGQVYLVFIASDGKDIADEAKQVVRKTLRVTTGE
ncbi:hypothetical protein [Pirellulimonas nuda]|nr:hypothetical protein [Pirellulimonas nuda]